MKTIFKVILTFIFAIFAVTPQSISAGLSPFSMNASLDPTKGTAAESDMITEINTLDGAETDFSEFISPQWLEILVLISPANFPISTFLTQKVMDGIKGLAKAESVKGGKYEDILIQTGKDSTKFNPKYALKESAMVNYKQFTNESVANYKLNWGSIAVRAFQDTVGVGGVAGGATTASIPVANTGMWTKNTLVKVQGATYTTSGEDLILCIHNVDVANGEIDVTSTGTDGTENIPAIVAGTRLTRMGPAHSELDVKNDHVTQSPTSDYNYAQKFITSVVYSNWMMSTALFTNYSFSLVTNLALQDFRYGQEFAFMFGNRSKFTAATGDGGSDQTLIATGGLSYYIDQEIEYGAGGGDTTITETDIVDFTKEMRVGNNGSDTRYLFAGSNLISALNKGVMNNSTRFVQKDYDTVYGLSFTVLYSFFGTINVMYAPLMDQSEYIDQGFLLDMQFIDKFVFQPFRQVEVDLVKLRDRDGKSIDISETCGLVARNLDTHFKMVVKS